MHDTVQNHEGITNNLFYIVQRNISQLDAPNTEATLLTISKVSVASKENINQKYCAIKINTTPYTKPLNSTEKYLLSFSQITQKISSSKT